MRRSVIAPTSPSGASHRKYLRIVQTAWNPSLMPIFLPSSYVRPWYEIGTSKMRARIRETLQVISGSIPKRWDRRSSRSTISRRMAL